MAELADATDLKSVDESHVGSSPTTRIMKTYELFSGDDLIIAELIQQRRLQLLVHSCIYYHLNTNIIPDSKWDEWAKELVQLQKQYPEISEQVIWYDAFRDWDASTGAFLPLENEWVLKKARQLAGTRKEKKQAPKKVVRKRLF